jgi:TolB-like protein/DNA-binding winged helix-turn-helix (wHTH) protein/Tfp pilus assembly protein PilF
MQARIYKFAEFELVVADSELRTGNTITRLQEKPLLLLCALLDHPQTLMTRQQLRERMWDTETFVDYEQGINVAINKVRDALGDSAEEPRFIQTIAKKGYRFLVPVEVIELAPVLRPAPAPSLVAGHVAVTGPPAARRHFSRQLWISAISAALILLATGLWLIWHAEHRQKNEVHAIAVLPLRNLSPDAGQDYFADGITEDVTTNLAQSLPLRVISRTSVMRYKETAEPIAQVARELGVDTIVEGAVARSGSRVSVTVQLIDAKEDRHLWARKYDRDIKDLLDVEAEVSQEIATQVGASLSAQHVIDASRSRTVDPEVYELCLWGRYFWNKREPADLAKSIEYFQQAIHRDPNYAPAYAGLAESYVILPSYDSVVLEDSFSKARTAASRAIDLDETLADAHAVLAFVALNHWMTDRKIAEREFSRALELNPNYATAHQWLAFHRLFEGKMDEAVGEMEHARQLDPLSAIINADEGHMLYSAGRNNEARAQLQRAIELEPALGQPHETLALIDLEEGNATDALREARAGLELDSSNPRTMAEAGYVLAVTGHTGEARNMLATLDKLDHRGAAFPNSRAFIYLGLGERDRAVDEIAQAETRKFGAGLRALQQWPIFNQLRGDLRYQKLMTSTWQ